MKPNLRPPPWPTTNARADESTSDQADRRTRPDERWAQVPVFSVVGGTCILCGNATMSSRRRTIHVSISTRRVFGSAVILAATIGAGTIGAAVRPPAPAAAAQVITVNDASDPVSQVPRATATRPPKPTAPCGPRWRSPLARGPTTASTVHGSSFLRLPTPSMRASVGSRLPTPGARSRFKGTVHHVVDISRRLPPGCGPIRGWSRVFAVAVSSPFSGVTISNGDPDPSAKRVIAAASASAAPAAN